MSQGYGLVRLLNGDGVNVAVLDAEHFAFALRIVKGLELVELPLEEDEVTFFVGSHGMLLDKVGVNHIAQVFKGIYNFF